MAIQMPLNDPTGDPISKAYGVPVGFSIDLVAGRLSIQFSVYRSASIRKAGKAPVRMEPIELAGADFAAFRAANPALFAGLQKAVEEIALARWSGATIAPEPAP